MLTLIVGDPHFKPSSLLLVKAFLPWLHEMVELHKPEVIVNLGDTFHTHNVIRSEVMALVDQHLLFMHNYLHASRRRYFILVGNHDMAHHKAPEIHSWLPYKGKYPNVIVCDGNSYGVHGSEFPITIPYIDDAEVFAKNLEAAMLLANKSKQPIFCHQTFVGADWGFVKAKDGVTVPIFTGQIISGHIHKQQDLGCVWYPGTPFAQEASDHNEVKGIFLYDTETKKRTFLRSPLPQWVTVHATPSDYQEKIAEMDPKDKNHLVIEGPGPEVNAVVDSKLFRDLKKDVGFSVKKTSTSLTKSTKAIKKVATVEDAVVEYIDKIYDGSVDKSKLKAKCLEALQ